VKPFEDAFHPFLEAKYPDVLHEIGKTLEVSDTIAARLDAAGKQCKEQLLAST
jgi:hypothetical protein